MTRRPALTPRRLEVLREVARLSARGYAPSLRELAAALGVSSTNGVAEFLDALEVLGLIRRTPGQPRTLTVTPEGRAALEPEGLE